MSTRCRIAYCFDSNRTVVSSYCHYDGYLEGVGYCLLDKYNTKEDAFYLASSGDFRSLLQSNMNVEGYYETRTIDQLEHFSKFPLPGLSDNLETLLKEFEDSDQDFLYVYFENAKCWKVFVNKWDKEKQKTYVDYIGDLESCIKKLNS